MRFSEFKRRRDVDFLIDLGELEIYPAPHNKLVKLVRDGRSYVGDGGFWKIRPLAFSWNRKTLFIACPYCGEIHEHSNAPGHRVSHCKQRNNEGYVLLVD